MKQKIILIIPIIILILSGCCEESQYHKIPDEDTMTFKIDDTLFFKNKQNIIEKFYVDDIKSVYLSEEEPKYSYCDVPNKYETRIIVFRKNVDTVNIYFQINQAFKSNKNNHFEEFFWNGFDAHIQTQYIINSKQVYVYEDTILNNENELAKIWLNVKEGVLKYQYKSGEVFELY